MIDVKLFIPSIRGASNATRGLGVESVSTHGVLITSPREERVTREQESTILHYTIMSDGIYYVLIKNNSSILQYYFKPWSRIL